ncbi:hypothetical protein, conserved [Eimeria praecox]|uniref:Transmembrane protein n=1 Tax=Eimeria praecox TaxID=51316 RepID=U6H4A8_9EIME|nr:hypothetical protein, conserved [Eimeria praecox]
MLQSAVFGVHGDQQQGEALKLSLPQLSKEFIVEEASPQASSIRPGQGVEIPVVQDEIKDHAKARRRRHSRLLSLTSAIPLIAILMFWSVCSAAHSRERLTGAVRRRLSDQDGEIDDVEQSVLEGCLALEEHLGILPPGEHATPYDNRSRRVAELAFMFYEAAATHELMHGAHSASGEASSSTTFPCQFQGQPLESHPTGQGFLEQGHGVGASAHADSLPTPPEGNNGVEKTPALDPDGWLDIIPDISALYEHQAQQQVPRDAGSNDLRAGTPSTSACAVRRAAENGEDTPEDAATRDHPFVRLPVLANGVVPRHFDVSVVTYRGQRAARPLTRVLLSLRHLFRQPCLDQGGANRLVIALEELVYAALVGVRTRALVAPPDLPMLGKYFLTFDFIVAGAQVLGPSMHLDIWWNLFAEHFDLTVALPPLHKHSRHCSTVQKILADRLLAALRIYKEGRRPPLKDVIELKRLLLCSPYTHRRFKQSLWDPWREDEELILAKEHRPR